MNVKSLVLLSAVCSATLGGCGIYERVAGPVDVVPTVYGAEPLTETDQNLPLDLPRVIAPELYEKTTPGAAPSRDKSGGRGTFGGVAGVYLSYPQPDYPYERQLSDAYKSFYSSARKPEEQAARRSQIQETLIGKSTTLCNVYKKEVLQTETVNKLLFGDLATVFGGLATIFAKTATVRPLAAAAHTRALQRRCAEADRSDAQSHSLCGFAGINCRAATFSGLRAEFNSDVFANLNIQVITAGIDKRRSEFYEAILEARRCSITQYPLEQAIKDAFYFHSSCSLIAGLEEANKSIKQAQDPGLDELKASLEKLGTLNSAALRAANKGTPGTAPTAPAAQSPPGVDLAISAGTQTLGVNCKVPRPGTPKSPAQMTPEPLIVMTPVGPVAMSFASDDDPIAALNAARGHVEKRYSDLSVTLAALGQTKSSEGVDAQTKNLNAAKDSFGTAADSVKLPDGTTPSAAQAAYNAAKINLENATKDNRDTLRGKLEAAHGVNADLVTLIRGVQSTFDDAADKVEAFIQKNTPTQ